MERRSGANCRADVKERVGDSVERVLPGVRSYGEKNFKLLKFQQSYFHTRGMAQFNCKSFKVSKV